MPQDALRSTCLHRKYHVDDAAEGCFHIGQARESRSPSSTDPHLSLPRHSYFASLRVDPHSMEMSRGSLFKPFKHLLRSSPATRHRCDWCRRHFEDHVELASHRERTAQIMSGDKQECIQGYRCDWCNVRFDTHWELSEHILDNTRVMTFSKKECLLDTLMQSRNNAGTCSFATARTTSTASYRTAPSFSHRATPSSASDPLKSHCPVSQLRTIAFYKALPPSSLALAPHDEFIRRILDEADEHGWCPHDKIKNSTLEPIFWDRGRFLTFSKIFSLSTLALIADGMVQDICNALISTGRHRPENWDKFRSVVARQTIDFIMLVCDWTHLTSKVDECFRQTRTCPLAEKSLEVSSSTWLNHLNSRGLLLDQSDELDWSGKGQHVEYGSTAEKTIPLVSERPLGHSATALVDSVLCRRIRLARKRIRCTHKLQKEDYIAEVEHLHHLQHAHILRVVGTYTFKKDLAILLYPVCAWNLEEFMDEMLDPLSNVNADISYRQTWQERAGNTALLTAFGCLSYAMVYIHGKNVKHMDIKPKNILIRPLSGSPGSYKSYIADFGIARSYTSAADAETDSPVSFTRTYAAPEVVLQDRRGFGADIFSLGCVFLEMLATFSSGPFYNERYKLFQLRTSSGLDSSYHANVKFIRRWFHRVFPTADSTFPLSERQLGTILKMIETIPHERPSAQELDVEFADLRCAHCDEGPEPFEAAGEPP